MFQERHPDYPQYAKIDDFIFEDIKHAMNRVGLRILRGDDHWSYLDVRKEPRGEPVPIMLWTSAEVPGVYIRHGDLTISGPTNQREQIDKLANYLEWAIPERGEAIGQVLAVAAGSAAARGAPGPNALQYNVAGKILPYVLGSVTPLTGNRYNRFRAAGAAGQQATPEVRAEMAAAAEAARAARVAQLFRNLRGNDSNSNNSNSNISPAPAAPVAPAAEVRVPEVAPSKTCGPLGCSIMGGSRKRKGRKAKKTKKAKKARVVKNRRT